jgi:hypothetical protein
MAFQSPRFGWAKVRRRLAGECPEWQRELTVNQPPYGFEGSSPSSPTILKTLAELIFRGRFLFEWIFPNRSLSPTLSPNYLGVACNWAPRSIRRQRAVACVGKRSSRGEPLTKNRKRPLGPRRTSVIGRGSLRTCASRHALRHRNLCPILIPRSHCRKATAPFTVRFPYPP